MIESEIAILSSVEHPNIIKLNEVFDIKAWEVLGPEGLEYLGQIWKLCDGKIQIDMDDLRADARGYTLVLDVFIALGRWHCFVYFLFYVISK